MKISPLIVNSLHLCSDIHKVLYGKDGVSIAFEKFLQSVCSHDTVIECIQNREFSLYTTPEEIYPWDHSKAIRKLTDVYYPNSLPNGLKEFIRTKKILALSSFGAVSFYLQRSRVGEFHLCKK